MVQFEFATGTVIGRDHRHVGRNNQDALTLLDEDGFTIGIVADGCSSGKFSEVGAHLGVRFLAENLREQLLSRGQINWDTATRQVLARLDIVAGAMGGNYKGNVEEYFLFTLVGVVVERTLATFFGLGDGAVYVNDEQLPIGPFPGNAPPYIGYGLLEGRVNVDPAWIHIRPWRVISVDELSHFLIGTDGVNDIAAQQDQRLPGMADLVGPVDQFWQQDRYFSANPILASRRLGLMARDWPRANPEVGLLSDDTTIIVGRKVPHGNDS